MGVGKGELWGQKFAACKKHHGRKGGLDGAKVSTEAKEEEEFLRVVG